MPAPTEPHEPKSSLLGSKITKSKESPASQCGNTAQGVAEQGRKSVKPQLMMANRLKAPILLIRCYSTGNLDMLWTTVQNVHRIFKLKVTDLREFPVVQWLRFSAFTAMTQVQFLVRELRSCKPQTVWPKKKERETWKECLTCRQQLFWSVPTDASRVWDPSPMSEGWQRSWLSFLMSISFSPLVLNTLLLTGHMVPGIIFSSLLWAAIWLRFWSIKCKWNRCYSQEVSLKGSSILSLSFFFLLKGK